MFGLETSESIAELSKALTAAQAEFKRAGKSAANPMFRSKYEKIHDLLDAVSEPLSKHGLSILQPIQTIDGTHYVVTILLHGSGQYLASRMSVFDQVGKGQSIAQAFGSGVSYIRRYALRSMLSIPVVDHDDDDGNSLMQGDVHARKVEAVLEKIGNAESTEELDRIGAEVKALGLSGAPRNVVVAKFSAAKNRLTETEKNSAS